MGGFQARVTGGLSGAHNVNAGILTTAPALRKCVIQNAGLVEL